MKLPNRVARVLGSKRGPTRLSAKESLAVNFLARSCGAAILITEKRMEG